MHVVERFFIPTSGDCTDQVNLAHVRKTLDWQSIWCLKPSAMQRSFFFTTPNEIIYFIYENQLR